MSAGGAWLSELKLAEAHFLAGRLADAETALRRILESDPNQADALNALAALASDAGRFDAAATFQKRALSVRPDAPLYWSNLAEIHRRRGELAQATECARKAIALRPSFATAHNTLGAVLADSGDAAAALKSYDTALLHRPDFPEAHNNRANALRALQRADEAEAALRRALALRPRYAEAYNNLGNVLRDKGRHDEAQAAYRQALDIRPGDVEPLFNLAHVLEEQGTLSESDGVLNATMETARRVLANAPENAEAANVLGIALVASGQLEEAVEAFRRATTKPGYFDPWLNLGNALKSLGRLDEAIAAFDGARKLAAYPAGLLLAISLVKKFRDSGDEHLLALEALARDADAMPPQQRLLVHFALGKACDDLERSDEAFDHWRAGNSIKRQSVTYDEVGAMRLLERTRQTFTREILRKGGGSTDHTPIFIVGMPRSGTTLVEQILSSHPKVGGAGEITAMNDVTRLVPGFPEGVARVDTTVFERVGETYVQKLRRYVPEAAHISDKTPTNFALIGLIHLALPNAKIVHVTRDAADTCISCYSKLFSRGQTYSYELGELGRYYASYVWMMRHWSDVLPADQILEVRYEDVIAKTEEESRRILAHCGLEWDDRVLSFHQTQRVVTTASASQVRQPIYASSVARWRRYEKHLTPLLDALGDLAGN